MLDVLCLLAVVGNLGVFAAGGPIVELPGGWKTGGWTDRLLDAWLVRDVLAGWKKPDHVTRGWKGTSWDKFAVETAESDLEGESVPVGRKVTAEILPDG